MLSEFQQKQVWEGWLSAEIRAAYFAALSQRFQTIQRWLTIASLVLSSGAALAFISSALPPSLGWVKAVLALSAAIVSAFSLTMRNERNAIESKDLHSRWNALAMSYEDLWADMTIPDADLRLRDLRDRENTISTSSTVMPEATRLLVRAQDNVVLHHQSELTAR